MNSPLSSSLKTYLKLCKKQVKMGPVRKIKERFKGAFSVVPDLELLGIVDEFSRIKNRLFHEEISPPEGLEQTTQACRTLASLRFSFGDPGPEFKRWAGLTAYGKALQGNNREALAYAAVAGEWEWVKRMRLKDRSLLADPGSLAWIVIQGENFPEEGEFGPDAAPWKSLAVSIPQKDHSSTESALQSIVQLHIQKNPDWQQASHPGQAQLFDPSLSAVAAFARLNGYVPQNLSEAEQAYLEAGMSPEDPEPMFSEFGN